VKTEKTSVGDVHFCYVQLLSVLEMYLMISQHIPMSLLLQINLLCFFNLSTWIMLPLYLKTTTVMPGYYF